MLRSIVVSQVLALVLLFAAGCSLFHSSRHGTNSARFVVTPHAQGGSAEILKRNRAARFVGKLSWPVQNGKVFSRFGPRRGRFHAGIDIPAPVGTPIRAACSGRVEFTGEDVFEFGTVLVLRCGELSIVYAHADEILVEVGAEVRQGAAIATVGKTGNATGPHLHFETRVLAGNKFISINPQLFYP